MVCDEDAGFTWIGAGSPLGYSDCIDTDATVKPDAEELCDGQYNDCNDPDYEEFGASQRMSQISMAMVMLSVHLVTKSGLQKQSQQATQIVMMTMSPHTPVLQRYDSVLTIVNIPPIH